jgi:hypothetical protein
MIYATVPIYATLDYKGMEGWQTRRSYTEANIKVAVYITVNYKLWYHSEGGMHRARNQLFQILDQNASDDTSVRPMRRLCEHVVESPQATLYHAISQPPLRASAAWPNLL